MENSEIFNFLAISCLDKIHVIRPEEDAIASKRVAAISLF
jgi:hypothetical protein